MPYDAGPNDDGTNSALSAASQFLQRTVAGKPSESLLATNPSEYVRQMDAWNAGHVEPPSPYENTLPPSTATQPQPTIMPRSGTRYIGSTPYDLTTEDGAAAYEAAGGVITR